MHNISGKDTFFALVGTGMDLLLWWVYLTGTSVGASGPRGVYKSFREADQMLEAYNHRTLSVLWHRLKKQKLVTVNKRKGLYSPEITAFGLKRLHEVIPLYHSHRPWDEKIYLITFDIPETMHLKRDLLRNFLLRSRCVMFQISVWLTVYNPRTMLNDFIRVHEIPGTVIVSHIGSDGGIGEITAGELLKDLYKLSELNDRYRTFIKNSKKATPASFKALMTDYLSILRDDPQLPFPLLPRDWQGEKAQAIYQQLLKNVNNFFATANPVVNNYDRRTRRHESRSSP